MNTQTALKMAIEWQEKTAELFEKHFDGDDIAEKAMIIPRSNYDQILTFHNEWQRWNIDLFSPKGIEMMFGVKL